MNWRSTLLLVSLLVLPAARAVAQDAPAPPLVLNADQRHADIAAFRDQFLAQDRSYSDAARTEAQRQLAALDAGVANESEAQFELGLSRIVALADNGHTFYFPGPRSRRFNRIATVRFSPFGEDFYVLRVSPENADLLGAKLVAIDGHPAAAVRDVARTLQGGLASWRDRNVNYVLESPEQMHALGIIASADHATYRFQLANGRMVSRNWSPGAPSSERVRGNSDRWFYPAPVEGEGGRWRTLLNVDQAPWSLRDPDTPFRMRDAPEIDAFVIELRQTNSSDDVDIAGFLFDSLEAARASGRHNIVLDMRMNGGGDLNFTRAWVRRLPLAVTGRIFVLTSPWTFSAAISTVGYLKQSAPDRVTIVGEHIGDRLNFFSEGNVVNLPNTGALMLFARERHDYVTGCRGYSDCHGPVVRNPISLPNLDPEIVAPWTIEAYRNGHDPAMDAIAAALRR